ncbi:hypothetical protein [Ornithinibacillus halotolerans]|uniref:hypothetical protein n=1 Tax=Ornithinibacillus halotolerans TaxID=1274357 RepID=UPI001662D524|nr:hypothetical protein [Ornithinibacillus halotolerans]
MTDKYTSRRLSTVIIWILSLLVVTVTILYFVKREDLNNTAMYFYELEVEEPLVAISYHLGVEPYEIVNWEEPIYVEELRTLISDLEEGMRHLDSPHLEGIPKRIHKEIQELQETFTSKHGQIIAYGGEISEETKQSLLDISKVIDSCQVREYNQNWKQIISEIECVNNGI